MKKFLFSFFIISFLIVSNSAFAFDLPNHYFTPEDIITIKNGVNGNGLLLWETSSESPLLQTQYTNGEDLNSLSGGNIQFGGNNYIVADIDNQDSECWSSTSLTTCLETLPKYKFFTFKGIPSGENFLSYGGMFYNRDGNNLSSATDLMAQAGNSASLTMETLGGIVGTIGGIIAGFGVILYIISIINETRTSKKEKKNI